MIASDSESHKLLVLIGTVSTYTQRGETLSMQVYVNLVTVIASDSESHELLVLIGTASTYTQRGETLSMQVYLNLVNDSLGLRKS